MITGAVNANHEATIQLFVSAPNGKQQNIEAIIDTGFTGFLTLPYHFIRALGLFWLSRQPGILGDGSEHVFDVYVANLIWDGRPRAVEVEAAETEPLIGTNLLVGYSLRMDVFHGGPVTITKLP